MNRDKMYRVRKSNSEAFFPQSQWDKQHSFNKRHKYQNSGSKAKKKPVCIIAVNMNEGRYFSPVFDDPTRTVLCWKSKLVAHTLLQRLQNCRQREWKLKRPTERERKSVPDACTLCVESESSTCICIERVCVCEDFTSEWMNKRESVGFFAECL